MPSAQPRPQASHRVVAVGPLSLTIEVDARLAAGLDQVLQGFDGLADAARALDVKLAIGLSAVPDPSSHALGSDATFSRVGDAVLGRSRLWRARLERTRHGVSATFELDPELVLAPRLDEEWRLTLSAAAVASAIRVCLSFAAPLARALLLHASAVLAPSGRALVFTGPSAEGKTTMTRRLAPWRGLADDAVIVFSAPDGWRAAGTPLQGSERLPRRAESARIEGLFFLHKAAELALTPLSEAHAFAALLPRILWFSEPEEHVIRTAHELVGSVPCLRLSSGLEHDVSRLLTREAGAAFTSAAGAPW